MYNLVKMVSVSPPLSRFSGHLDEIVVILSIGGKHRKSLPMFSYEKYLMCTRALMKLMMSFFAPRNNFFLVFVQVV